MRIWLYRQSAPPRNVPVFGGLREGVELTQRHNVTRDKARPHFERAELAPCRISQADTSARNSAPDDLRTSIAYSHTLSGVAEVRQALPDLCTPGMIDRVRDFLDQPLHL